MKCKVCGAESGRYPLCKSCNAKKEKGLVVKCERCGQWHGTDAPCPEPETESGGKYLYEPRKTLISRSEQEFFQALKASVPENYHVFPQINLASFIDRTDDARYHNELFRNIDFLITDGLYAPKIAVEINDQTHLEKQRRARDEKVLNILEEAGLPLLRLWTSYGVNPEYIRKKIAETLAAPTVRKRHSAEQPSEPQQPDLPSPATSGAPQKKKSGCYVATCVYGSYDCPEVWVLRRYRDRSLAATRRGRLFIRLYYTVSPSLVRLFGEKRFFRSFFKKLLDRKVASLREQGVDGTPYRDPVN